MVSGLCPSDISIFHVIFQSQVRDITKTLRPKVIATLFEKRAIRFAKLKASLIMFEQGKLRHQISFRSALFDVPDSTIHPDQRPYDDLVHDPRFCYW